MSGVDSDIPTAKNAEGRVMKCRELLAALNEYIDGDTQTALCRALQQHLADCNSCRIVIDNIRYTISLCRAEEEVPLPQGVRERVRQTLRGRWAAEFRNDRDRESRPSISVCHPNRGVHAR
jgi:hypothetical protein